MTEPPVGYLSGSTVGRRIGAVLAMFAGLFWLGWLINAESRSSRLVHVRHAPQLNDFAPILILIVLPSIACIIGGWLTLRSAAGWRWPPIIVCTLYALLLARSPRVAFGTLILVWDAAIAILLLLPDPHARMVRQLRLQGRDRPMGDATGPARRL